MALSVGRVTAAALAHYRTVDSAPHGESDVQADSLEEADRRSRPMEQAEMAMEQLDNRDSSECRDVGDGIGGRDSGDSRDSRDDVALGDGSQLKLLSDRPVTKGPVANSAEEMKAEEGRAGWEVEADGSVEVEERVESKTVPEVETQPVERVEASIGLTAGALDLQAVLEQVPMPYHAIPATPARMPAWPECLCA